MILLLAVVFAFFMDQGIEWNPERTGVFLETNAVCSTAVLWGGVRQKKVDSATVAVRPGKLSVQKVEFFKRMIDKFQALGIRVRGGRFSINRVRMVINQSIPIARLIPFPVSHPERPRRFVR